MSKRINSGNAGEWIWLALVGMLAVVAFLPGRISADPPAPCNGKRVQPDQACPGRTQTAHCTTYKDLGEAACNAATNRVVYQEDFTCDSDAGLVKYHCSDLQLDGISVFGYCTRTYQCVWNSSDGTCLRGSALVALDEFAVLKSEVACPVNGEQPPG